MQKWMVDNADRVLETIVDESGKTYEDAQRGRGRLGAGALGFWAKTGQVPGRREGRTNEPDFLLGTKLVVRYGRSAWWA